MKVSSSGFTGEELARYWHSYKKSLSAQQISEGALYVDYVNAVVDMVKDNYFTPPRSNSDVLRIVGLWLESHRARWNERANLLIVEALTESFPLQRSKE